MDPRDKAMVAGMEWADKVAARAHMKWELATQTTAAASVSCYLQEPTAQEVEAYHAEFPEASDGWDWHTPVPSIYDWMVSVGLR